MHPAFLLALSLLLSPVLAWAAEITVTSAADTLADDGLCTLREAVISANNNAPSGPSPGECPSGNSGSIDSIVLPAGTFTLTIPSGSESATGEDPLVGDLDLLESVNIEGAGIEATRVDGGLLARLFHADAASATVTFTDLEIKRGNSTFRGAGIYFEDGISLALLRVRLIDNTADDDGGGVYATNTADVSITDSIVISNDSGDDGGGISWGGCFGCSQTLQIESTWIEGNHTTGSFASHGGGVYAGDGIFILNDTTVHDNDADDLGGGLYVDSDLFASSSTISLNTAASDGGGIYFDFPGTSQLENCSISQNDAGNEGGGIAITSNNQVTLTHVTLAENTALSGSAIADGPMISLKNTIVSGTCVGGFVQSLGGNIESPGDNCGLDQASDQIAVPAGTLALGSLSDNGGTTRTHMPSKSSAAIDQADDVGCPVDDQRGVSRPQSVDCDIGSVERIFPIFVDGFESGDTTAWSSSAP